MSNNEDARPAGSTRIPRFPAWAMAVALWAAAPGDDNERGDVPGWVMITLMSAILVAGLLAIASPALENLFNQAMSKVGN